MRFGEVRIKTELWPRDEAEEIFKEALTDGKQAALLARESPNVFTLRVAGIKPGENVVIEIDYVQMARKMNDQAGWQLRVPLTTAPRYVWEDELESKRASGQPLALLRDPGHRFSLNLEMHDVVDISSPTYQLRIAGEERSRGLRATLLDGEVVPDRDFILNWVPLQEKERPKLHVHQHQEESGLYFLALVAPPSLHQSGMGADRETIVVVDHSGSMRGAKWEASDWAVKRFLTSLREQVYFALGVFHDTTSLLKKEPVSAEESALNTAFNYLKENSSSGGTNLGVALE